MSYINMFWLREKVLKDFSSKIRKNNLMKKMETLSNIFFLLVNMSISLCLCLLNHISKEQLIHTQMTHFILLEEFQGSFSWNILESRCTWWGWEVFQQSNRERSGSNAEIIRWTQGHCGKVPLICCWKVGLALACAGIVSPKSKRKQMQI